MPILQPQDIIIFGLQPWDIELGSNCKCIATELAKKHRVLYVNRPLDRVSLWRKKDQITQNRKAVIRGKKEALQKINENFWVMTPPILLESINWLNSYWLFQKLNYWNNYRLAKSIRKYTELLGFDNPVLFNDSSMFMGFYLKELLKPRHFIYYIRDYLISQNYFKKHGKKAEATLIAKADTIVTNSNYLTNYAKQFNQNSYFVGQGCDLTAFDPFIQREIPPNIQEIQQPIIGYVGLLTSRRLDIDLLIQLAKQRPNYALVLVGAEDQDFQDSQLHQLPNVHFLGFQAPETLPDYIHSFDVCINPQVVNAMSKGNYPRKIDEYLAMGKPVVATHTPTMELFKNHVRLANSTAEYIQHIDQALSENSAQQNKDRIDFAQTHTWENSVHAIWNAIKIA
ncbi:MAG: glycosyltransferase [Saprospiraceae bacterium]|nr:glycosyltransferase [Saprospiraceae bacterium]